MNLLTSAAKKNSVRETATAWIFLFPFLLFYGGFLLFPILRGFYTSFFDSALGRKDVWVGIENYVTMFGDGAFWESIFNTVFFVVISTPAIVIVGFILAMFINAKLRGTTFLRTAFFAPYVLSMSVVTGLWIFVYQPYSGLISGFLTRLGMEEIFWLDTKWLVWLAILITTVWWTVGFDMVLFLAGLQNIPDELYEAAQIDGASKRQALCHITIPMLRETTVLVVLLQMIASFKLFGQTYLMARGGPGTHTRTIVQYIYETGFTNKQMGLASAMSVAFFILVLLFSFFQKKITRPREEGTST